MSRLIALDTTILINATKAPNENEPNIEICAELLNQLHETKAVVCIPVTVVAEYLAGLPDDDVEASAKFLRAKFQIAPFDAPAAVRAAQLRKKERQNTEPRAGCRRDISPDCQILAIALTSKATTLYTTDEKFIVRAKKLNAGISVCAPTRIVPSLSLFPPQEIEEITVNGNSDDTDDEDSEE